MKTTLCERIMFYLTILSENIFCDVFVKIWTRLQVCNSAENY